MTVQAVSDGLRVMERFGIGRTPLIRLPGLTKAGGVWLKAEYANPFGSVKDRTAAYLLAWAHAQLGPGVSVVESTSGNLGVALARIGRQIGVPVTLVMDASLPARRIDDVRRTGAAVTVVEERHAGLTFRESRIATARRMGRRPGWIWLNQYANEAGLQAHEQTTGPEIRDSFQGEVDAVVASVGTGGTLCGISAALRHRAGAPLIVGVEPVGSTISGGAHGSYLPAGSGMRGTPEVVARHRDLLDCFAKVPDHLSAAWALRLLRRFGIEVGQTTGAAVAVAAMLAEQRDARVAVVAPDRGRTFRTLMRGLAGSVPGPYDSGGIQIVPFGRGDAASAEEPR